MFEMLFSAFLLGVAVTIPPGAVVVAAGKRAITQGFWSAFSFNAGSMLADTCYVLAVYFGLAPLLAENITLRLLLWIIGGAWLAWLGWDALRTRVEDNSFDGTTQNNSHYRLFISGIGITLFNPMVIVSWIALAGAFFANWQAHWPPQNSVGLLAIGSILLGVFCWMMGLLITLSRARRWIPAKFINWASMMAGVFLLLLAFGSWQAAAAIIISM